MKLFHHHNGRVENIPCACVFLGGLGRLARQVQPAFPRPRLSRCQESLPEMSDTNLPQQRPVTVNTVAACGTRRGRRGAARVRDDMGGCMRAGCGARKLEEGHA